MSLIVSWAALLATKLHILPLFPSLTAMPDEESLSDGSTLGADANASSAQDSGPAAAQSSRPQGYQRLADFMADHQAHAVFRQFGSLNMLNLLYYQAELTQLEQDLCEAARVDRESADRYRQLYFRSFWLLSHGETDNDDTTTGSMAQWELVLKLRGLMKEYSVSSLSVTTSTIIDICRRGYHSTAHSPKTSTTKETIDELHSALALD